ncbi:pitrilysin family protein [Pelomonas sp. SE-A7]|uniref:M16 family metallopeptidase n=1 Tax=Pelomonas sp. SE-A7 TaxID=3054953 RepID=UPI00259C795C|nr:pitrilysin family protein [Pelomonas sp. SE-A7]MDM4768131.1 pitrilysin family protein [Pelomonas sp. SE-A7]
MRARNSLARLSLALSLAGLCSLAAAHSLKPQRAVEGITEYRLANGLQVLLAPDDSKPTTTVNVTYRVGSKHENYGETGMAHLLEHLIFKGSPKYPAPWDEFSKRGLMANGSTWFDRTNYFAAFAANEANLKWYLEWQADAMVHSHIAKRHLDTEMTVVRNEMEMGENDPGNATTQRALAAMFQWHNYGKDTIGARADVENVDISRLQAFYRQYYQPDNATLIVSGKFDANKVLDWVEQSFAKLPKPKRQLKPTYTNDPVQDGENQVTVRRTGGTAQSLAAYHIPAGPHPDYAAIELLNLVLAQTPGGRLHKRLVEEKKLAASVGHFGLALAEPGFTSVSAELAPQASHEEMNKELLAVAESFASQPLSAEELQRARTKWLNDWERRFTSPESVGITLSEYIAQGDWRLFFLLRDRIKAIKLEEVQRVATEYLQRSNRTLAQYIPTDKPLRAPAPSFVQLDKELAGFKPQAAAQAVAAFEASPANIDKQTQLSQLTNGMKLALLAKPSRGEAVRGQLQLRFGTAESLQGQQAAAEQLAAMLSMGTERLNRQQLRDALDAAKVELNVSAQRANQLVLSWATKREHASEALRLIAEMLRQPRFEAAALEELRAQGLTAIQSQRDEPQALASVVAQAALNKHPRGHVFYARNFAEQEQDLKALKLDDLRQFHARFYGADAGQLSLVGDFDAAALKAEAEKLFGSWRATTRFARTGDKASDQPGRVQQVVTPDKQNAMLFGILPMPIDDDHPDRAALQLANHLLGGSMSSRLWMRIREKEGLSYGVGSGVSLRPRDPDSAWFLYAIFAPQNRAKVETALREEVARALAEGFTAQEVADGRQALVNESRMMLAQDPALADLLSRNLYLDRRMDRQQQLIDAIGKLTPDAVNAALRRHFKLDGFQLVFAGDFK